MWCSLQVTCGDHEDNMRVLHAKLSCSCVQTREFFKNSRVELQKHACHSLACLKFKLSCTVTKVVHVNRLRHRKQPQHNSAPVTNIPSNTWFPPQVDHHISLDLIPLSQHHYPKCIRRPPDRLQLTELIIKLLHTIMYVCTYVLACDSNDRSIWCHD